jgi:HD superfamily phosphodiesterase
MITQRLFSLAQKYYKNRDRSHGIEHVMQVRENALMICDKLKVTDNILLLKIEAVAIFHDAFDHKYINHDSQEYKHSIKSFKQDLKSLFFSDTDIYDINIIINNISLSREQELRKKGEELNLKHLQHIRDIVSDADKIEMLGLTGVERIIVFEKNKNKDVTNEGLYNKLNEIYETKLSKLLCENYIKTSAGRELAEPLIGMTKEIINNKQIVNGLITQVN